MVRTQIQLSEAQADGLKRLAAEMGVSMAELIRRSVDKLLSGSSQTTDEERRRRALEAIGCARGGPPDLAREHDRYLNDAFDS